MAPRKKLCIVGGGASGVSLMWCLAQDARVAAEWDITLLHDGPSLGGHSHSWLVQHNGVDFQVDIGVQLIAPLTSPNVRLQLDRPEFQKRVAVDVCDELKIACSFPRHPETGAVQSWGNFESYQTGEQFALYSKKIRKQAKKLQREIQFFSPFESSRSLGDYFRRNRKTYSKPFLDYVVWPYMSSLSGYGAALLDQVAFEELFPLFGRTPLYDGPQASFTEPGRGWWRFRDGARSWVQAMADIAEQAAECRILFGATAQMVFTDRDAENAVEVRWMDASGEHAERFDRVVLTTDMWTNAKLLKNRRNEFYWDKVYRDHVAKKQWGLLPGHCYLHTDEEMLSPDLRNGEEAVQFNAYHCPTKEYPYYDFPKSFTTYLQENLRRDRAAKGLFLTLYGYVPDAKKGDKVPDPAKVLHQKPWRRGMWAPSQMTEAKTSLWRAQSQGLYPYPGQKPTNVFFAGNNTTMDSEEGALLSAMIVANYGWGVPYPLLPREPYPPERFLHYQLASGFYDTFYHDVMFPKRSANQKLAHIYQALQR